MTAAASLSRTMPTQGAAARSQQDDSTRRYLEQYNKASVNERIRMLEILRATVEKYQLSKELQEAGISGTVSDEQPAQFKRRRNELGRSTKGKQPRADNTYRALQNEKTTTARSDSGNNYSPLARALQKIAQRSVAQTTEKQEATGNRPWRNVPQYYAARKERLKHRPAKASNNNRRAYRLRLIQESQHVH